MKMNKRGGISEVVANIIGIMILSMIFYHYFFVNLDLERYNILNQYSRDILLVCETKDTINKSYLTESKSKLSQRLVKTSGEYVKIYISINGTKYDVDTMPNQIRTDFGETIEILTEYHYKPQRLDFSKKLVPSREVNGLTVMGVKLTTVSKNRGTSDG